VAACQLVRHANARELTGEVIWEGGGVAPNNGLVVLGSGILVSGFVVVRAGAVDPPSVGGGVAP
jgi:hypothetical protein